MRKVGWGVVVEPGEFEPFVLGEAVLMEEVEGVVPLSMDAEVEDTQAEFLGDFGEVVFGVRNHADFNAKATKSTDHRAK